MKTTLLPLTATAFCLLYLLVPSVVAQDIISAEYYFDTDPGFYQGTPIAVVPAADVTLDFIAEVAGLNDGHHTLYVRAQDANGRWSLTTTRPFFKEALATGEVVNITEIHYTLKRSSNVLAEATVRSFTPAPDVATNFVIDSGNLEVGEGYALQLYAVDEHGRQSLLLQHGFSVNTNRFPIVVNPLPDFTLNAGFGTIEGGDLADVFSDPDLPNDNLSFSATVSNDLLEVDLSGTILSLSSTSSADGRTIVTVIAADNDGARAESIFTVILGTGVATEEPDQIPRAFMLEQNYPNPFNPSTTIQFEIPTASHVALNLYSLTGKRIATLVDEFLSPGSYQTTWNGSRLASGVYLYELRAGTFSETKMLVLLK